MVGVHNKLTARAVLEYQQLLKSKKTVGEYKLLGVEMRDKFNLTDSEVIDLLNNRNVLDIFAKYEEKDE